MAVFIVLLCACLSLATSEFTCPTLFNYYPDAHDCTKFYRCNWGKGQQYICPAGTRWSQDLLTCDHTDNVACHKTPVVTETLVNNHGYLQHIITPQPHAQAPDFSVDYDEPKGIHHVVGAHPNIYASGNFDYHLGGYKSDNSRFYVPYNRNHYASYYNYPATKYVQGHPSVYSSYSYGKPYVAYPQYQARFVKTPRRQEMAPLPHMPPQFDMKSAPMNMLPETNMQMMPSENNMQMMAFDSNMRPMRDADVMPQGQERLTMQADETSPIATDMSRPRPSDDDMYSSYLLNKLMNQPNYEEYVKMPNGQWASLGDIFDLSTK